MKELKLPPKIKISEAKKLVEELELFLTEERTGLSKNCVMVYIPDSEEGSKSPFYKDWSKCLEMVKEDEIYTKEGFGKELNPHVTILYGLTEDKEVFDILDYLETLSPPTLEVGELSSFRNEGEEYPYDVLKFEISSPDIKRINSLLKKKFKNKESFPVFVPHLTLAYVKKGACIALEGKEILKGKKFSISGGVFCHRNGRKIPFSFRLTK